MEPREALRQTADGIRGTSACPELRPGRRRRRPELVWDPDLALDENADIWQALYESVLILNDALPPEFQIELAGYSATRFHTTNELYVSLETAASIATICGEGAVAR